MRIGLIGNNSVEYIEHLLDIWNSNDSVVLIDSSTPPLMAFSMLSEAHAEECYVERLLFDDCAYTPPSLKVHLYNTEIKMPCILPNTVRVMFKPRYDESEAVVIYSSGTTGKCKGISLSHRAVNNNADSIIDYMNPAKEDCFYLNKKLTHCSSLIGELLVALKSGADILVSPLVIPPRVAFKNISDYGVSILCCNPTLLKLYADETERTNSFPKSVRKVYTSGDVISVKDIERARINFNCPVYNVYGQSECGPRITAQTEGYCSVNSVGTPIKNVEIKTDENGEILVRTNALFSGYTNEEDTVQKEWHRTGDIGYTDNNGELYVIGRTDNMIVIEAHNVYPETVEKTIVDKTPITDCLVYKNGDRLVCEYCSDTDMNLISITKILREHLMPYEIPKVYKRVDRIPRNRNGKKLRNRNTEAEQ